MKNEECCPKFNPDPWDEKIFEWKNKLFIKGKIFSLFNIPINFGKVIKNLNIKIEQAQATIPDYLCLSDHTSKWNMNLYLAVDKEIPSMTNVTLSGKFLSKVYEGPFKDTGKWCKDFEMFAQSKKLTISRWYMWYTTCPKCAKKYRKNYIVIIGEVA